MAEPACDNFDDQSSNVSIQQLSGMHREILTQAVVNVLSTPIAEVTFGQIIDGLPISDVAVDIHLGTLCDGHPLLDERYELSSEVISKAQELCSTVDATKIRMNPKLLQDYQVAAPGSRAFQMRLIELVAIATHQVGVLLYKQTPILDDSNHLVSWRPEGEDLDFYPDGWPATFFRHSWYHDFDQYPHGVADMVGYWAESRIFGGVVLFDRRQQDFCTEADPDAIYFHADRREVTYRVFKLLDDQKQKLLQFLLSPVTPPPSCPLPILGDKNNRTRVDPEEPIQSTGIYRNLWERKPLGEGDYDDRLRDVVDTFNYLSQDDWAAAKRRALLKYDNHYSK
ncbi:hypothetical protein EDB81DRAFT_906450 [Dactylonectria macrodidyma]|uniref:Uncharacterized protein n=1 Tax=Dactylonectria macrodidyma TaxID=307937 RepID=A0A9P9E633_9HYPO|nr:hypothetical protein EDB81DRAFT_906450 [Dactylonectria macrodidyma]